MCLSIPVTVIFVHAAGELGCNNGCGPFPKKGQRDPCSRSSKLSFSFTFSYQSCICSLSHTYHSPLSTISPQFDHANHLSPQFAIFLQPAVTSSSSDPNILKHPQSITDNQEYTINMIMHSLCHRKLHVSVSVHIIMLRIKNFIISKKIKYEFHVSFT